MLQADGATHHGGVSDDGSNLRNAVTISGSTFTPPSGRHDTLVQNADGTYSLTPQFTRSIYKFNADGSLASLTDDYGNVIAYTNDGYLGDI